MSVREKLIGWPNRTDPSFQTTEPNRSILATDRAEPTLFWTRPNRTDYPHIPTETRTEPKVNRRSGSVRVGLQLSKSGYNWTHTNVIVVELKSTNPKYQSMFMRPAFTSSQFLYLNKRYGWLKTDHQRQEPILANVERYVTVRVELLAHMLSFDVRRQLPDSGATVLLSGLVRRSAFVVQKIHYSIA